MKRYTAGFLFSEERTHVVLIQKLRPEWQRGRWNGVGGGIEDGETKLACQVREFEEEAGLHVVTWEPFCVLSGTDFEVTFFRAFAPLKVIRHLKPQTDEHIDYWDVNNLPPVIPNLNWLIPMALSMDHDACVLFRITESV